MIQSQILVCEDESVVALDIQKALQGFSYKVTRVVSSGEDAIRAAGETRPDLVLMDIRLAGAMDGIEAAARIRRELDIPVVYLTAFADESTLQKAKSAAPYGYLVKPFRQEELRTSIEVAIHQHQLEKRLKNQEEWLATILRCTGDAVVVTDPKGVITYMNPVAEAMLNWRLSDARGQSWREGFTIFEEMPGGGHGPVERALQEGVRVGFSSRAAVTLANSTEIPIGGSVAPLKGAGGQTVGLVMVFRDVSELRHLHNRLRLTNEELERRVEERTADLAQANEDLSREILERRQAEARLRESEMKFRSLAESAADAILLADQQGLILYGNRSALSLFAVFEEEIAGRSLRQCVAAPDRAVLDGMIEKLSATQRPVDVLGTVEISGLSKIGRVFPMEMSLASWKTGSNRYFAATFRDISERRKMEENIRKSAAQIADLYDNAPCGYHSVDRNGVVVQMNATELAWLGHSRDEVIGKRKLTDLIVPPDRHVYEENFPVLTSEGRIADLEFRLQRKDGTEFPVIMSATAVKDEHGGFVMSRATVYDLTDRRRAEEAMRESELKFRSIAESAQDGIVLADRNGRIVYENRSARVLFAYTDPGLVGREIRDLVSEAHHAELSEVLKKAAGKDPKGLGHVYEWSGVDRHGRTFPMELSFASWTGDGKRFIAGIIRDVTERRRAEAHLKFQAEILAQVKDAVVVTNSGGQIIYCSPAAETLTGRKMSEAIGQDLRNVVGEVVKPEAEKEMIEAINAGHVWRGETVHRRKDGKELAVEFSISPLRNETGQPVGRLHIIREVTQQKKLQDMLMHAEKLAAMGQMAAAVAHELKTPLSVIFGFADVMLKKIKPEHKTEHPLDVIKRQAMRCSNLVTNLLEFSRKEKAVHREFFDLNEPVESALSLVQAHAQTSSIRVDKRLASGTLRLLGNRDLVQQVVINLCLNAVDAMSRGGTLTVNTRVRKFSRGEFAQIQVTDTGPGIPPDIRERIFEPFFTTKKSDKGTGLGLWLVKEIVSALGGEIECRSEIGNGTDFTVLLPLPEEAEEDAETPSRGESPRKKKTGPKPRLAVVDDEKDFRDLLARWLESNYEVDCYSEGEGIVSELTERRPDLIILDVRMPGIDGFEICRRIRTEKKLAQVPILFLTASKKDLQTLATLEFGANSHMSKPVERENLLRRLEELLLSVPAE